MSVRKAIAFEIEADETPVKKKPPPRYRTENNWN
jgi:hypothetical protein